MGSGSAHFARGFRDEFKVTVPILVDPERRSYKLLGMARGLGSMLKLSMLRSAQRARKAGFTQSEIRGDAMQQGGVLVVKPDGTVCFAYHSEAAGDHPPVDEVVAAVVAAAG